VFQPAERFAVNDPIAIALERRADVVFLFGTQTAARFSALGGLRRENLALADVFDVGRLPHGTSFLDEIAL